MGEPLGALCDPSSREGMSHGQIHPSSIARKSQLLHQRRYDRIRYVAQNAKTADLSAIHFVSKRHLPIGKSAASFISRAGAVAHTPDEFKL
jgi:hypothetical protein